MTQTILSTAAGVCALLALPAQAKTTLFDCIRNCVASPACNTLSLTCPTTGNVACQRPSAMPWDDLSGEGR